MSLSLYVIEGIITAPLTPACGMESEETYPFLRSKNLKNVQGFRLKTTSDDDPNFWKKRTIQIFLKAPYFISATFIPPKLSSFTLLFLQKVEGDPVGFYCPYLDDEKKVTWKASSQTLPLRMITDLQSVDCTLEGIDATIYQYVRECLEYFLSDKTTHGFVLTFKGPHGTPESRFWSKCEIFKKI